MYIIFYGHLMPVSLYIETHAAHLLTLMYSEQNEWYIYIHFKVLLLLGEIHQVNTE